MSPAGRRCRRHGGGCMSGRPFARGAMTVDLEAWIKERRITEVECMVSDVSGIPRGKILPASKFLRAIGERGLRIPESIFGLTVTGDYIEEHDLNPRASDVYLRPAPESIRVVPWYKEPPAQVICDAFYFAGAPVDVAPRHVLRRVLAMYAAVRQRVV